MLDKAVVTVDLRKIAENTRRVVDAVPGVEIAGVTKVTSGSPEVGRAMLAGGAAALADSRLENLEGLRAAGIDAPLWLLRAPTPGLAEKTVRLADVSLASELESVKALDTAARAAGVVHRIVAMVDVGDLREGMMPADLPGFLAEASRLEGIEVHGIGTSMTCYGAIIPTAENLGLLVDLARRAEEQLGRPVVVSGGMSTTLDAHIGGEMPPEISNLRVGEAIVLGVSPATRDNILGLHTDAVTLSAPVIECKVKPSRPIGISAQDAFGNRPHFEDRGLRRRAICAIGRQDVVPEGIVPTDPRVSVLGASSDHLILDVNDVEPVLRVGDAVTFIPGYSATLALFTSAYVEKDFVNG